MQNDDVEIDVIASSVYEKAVKMLQERAENDPSRKWSIYMGKGGFWRICGFHDEGIRRKVYHSTRKGMVRALDIRPKSSSLIKQRTKKPIKKQLAKRRETLDELMGKE